MHAPAIQLARGDATNTTASATSSGVPNRPNGSSRFTIVGDARGVRLLPPIPAAAGEQDRARRDAVHANAVRRVVARERLRERDDGGLRDVVAGCATGLAAPDRRDHRDRSAASRVQVRHRALRDPRRRPQVHVERLREIVVVHRARVARERLADDRDHASRCRRARAAAPSTAAVAPSAVVTSATIAAWPTPGSSPTSASRSSLAARDRRDARAFARERERDRAADAAARAGDEARLAREPEIHHGISQV